MLRKIFLFIVIASFVLVSCGKNELEFPSKYTYNNGVVVSHHLYVNKNGVLQKISSDAGSFKNRHRMLADSLNFIINFYRETLPFIESYELLSQTKIQVKYNEAGFFEVVEAAYTLSGNQINGVGQDGDITLSDDFESLNLCAAFEDIIGKKSDGKPYFSQNIGLCAEGRDPFKNAQNILADQPPGLKYDSISISLVDFVYKK